MKSKVFILMLLLLQAVSARPQLGWKLCTSPSNSIRIDDLFMVNAKTGFAVNSDGLVMRTTDSGNVWTTAAQFSNIYLRSVEFVNERKGFAGGFPQTAQTSFMFAMTDDSGRNWTDLASRIDPIARRGICGLAVGDSNTIYGCGNWRDTMGYIVKSVDGGNTWSLIDMSAYASSIIDMYFLNKDEGFATGRSPGPLRTATILHTTDGGATWTVRFKNTQASEYCWKIYRMNSRVYYASIEDAVEVTPKILKSTDGGMNWQIIPVNGPANTNHLQGVGFLNENTGWAGGWTESSYETNNGGITWKRIPVCMYMNRVFKVSDSLLFAAGSGIWKYGRLAADTVLPPSPPVPRSSYFTAYPNPVNKTHRLNIRLTVSSTTHVLFSLFDQAGMEVVKIDNQQRTGGIYDFNIPGWKLPAGIYYLVLKTHEEKQVQKILFTH